MKWTNLISTYALVLFITTVVQAQVLDGSFEATPVLQTPSTWFVTGGTVYVSDTPDSGFPTAGNKYLVLDSLGAGPALAGYGPHGFNNTAQANSFVTRPPGQFCSLSVDWEYLPGEPLPHPVYNDFMSIDVINNLTGTLIANVVYIDSGITAGTPLYTNIPGAAAGQLTWVPNQSTVFPFMIANPAPAGAKRASVDLSAVPVGTPMTIEINVGNGFDSEGPSRAYIDRVVLYGGQQNNNAASAGLRVLGSTHFDGLPPTPDWSNETLSIAPYTFRTSPGQRLRFRASGLAGLHWALLAGNLIYVGVPTPFGQINVDVFSGAPFAVLIDGAILPSATTWVDAFVPDFVPLGTQLTLQGVMEQVGGGLAVSAATTIEVGAPQIPLGGAGVGGGAVTDDGSTNQAFVAFGGGSWPFFGVPRTSVNVNSNGSVSFGAGDANPTETETGMFTGPARIAAIWDDLLPPGGVIKAHQTPATYTVSWTSMPENPAGLPGNNFSIQLYQAPTNVQNAVPGIFTIFYGSTTMADGLTGVSAGGLPAPPPNSSNVNWTSLAASLGARGIVPAGTAKFERFAAADDGSLRDAFDLMSIGGFSRMTFVPDGSGGYTYFVGTR
jgi:hypothetical protein